MILGTLFVNPMPLQTHTVLWLLLPLCLAVSLIYKTIRTEDVGRIWIETLKLVVQIVAGLAALGVSLWLIQRYWPYG